MSNILKGKLGWKGERGYSAYEIAVQNGFEGTEQDWLATLGTSSHFDEYYALYTIEDISVKKYDLPESYVSGTFVTAYLNGNKIPNSLIEIDTTNSQVELKEGVVLTLNDKLEIVEEFLSTNNLPITDTISADSTNDTAPGSKCVYDAVKEVSDDLSTLNTSVSALELLVNQIKSSIHPVGSVYISINDTNPSTLFGGTWEQIAQGRVLVGVGTGTDSNSHTKTFTAENNGGEYTHTLSINEMPAHTHEITANNSYTPGGAYNHTWDAGDSKSNIHTTGSTGGSQAHNIVNPSFGVYIWKRTA